MSKIITSRQPSSLIVPKRIIKEWCDEAHRTDWEDPDRYARQKAKALRYIEARAKEVEAWEKLLREVTRVFHDDLATDHDVIAATQKACYENSLLVAAAYDAPEEPERGEVRGVSDDEAVLESLEWQRDDEEKNP